MIATTTDDCVEVEQVLLEAKLRSLKFNKVACGADSIVYSHAIVRENSADRVKAWAHWGAKTIDCYNKNRKRKSWALSSVFAKRIKATVNRHVRQSRLCLWQKSSH